MKNDKLIGVNERGRRVGESHPRATLSDHEIDLARELHEEHGLGCRRLARKFDCSRGYMDKVLRYLKRAQTATRHKRRP